MLKKLIKNKKAQQTAEYALLISLVVAAVIAMQTYAQRTIQARIRDAASYLNTQTSTLGTTNQYEPYYLESSYDVSSDLVDTEIQTNDGTRARFVYNTDSTRDRATGGFNSQDYDTGLGLVDGI
jgi:uncharacterized protein (UPF0333 family)